MSVNLNWNGDAFERQMRQAAASRLLAAASLLQAEAKRDYSRSNPAPHLSPAPQGEFPRGRTWNLRDSIAVVPTKVKEIERTLIVRVGWQTNAKYGFYLWKRGWKGIEDTLMRVRSQLERVLGSNGSVRGTS